MAVGSGKYNDTTYVASVGDTYTELTFPNTCYRVDIWVWTYGVTVKRKAEKNWGYDDEFRLDAGSLYTFDCKNAMLAYKNTSAGSAAALQVVAWY